MKSSKKIIIVIIVMMVLLLMAGAAFAYVYVATDVFRTDKEMFFKYFAQLTSEEDGFWNKKISTFNEKKTQNAYENSGKITVEVEYPEESMEEIIEKVNDLSINYSGKVDSVNQKVEQNIEIDYGNDVVLPINYKQNGYDIGLQTDELSKKYIAARTDDLKQLAKNLGIDDVSQIPNKIEEIVETEEIENIDFTNEEIETLKQIYGTVLQQKILEDNFSKNKTDINETYTLQLSGEQLKDIVLGMLEVTTQNTLLIDKINEFMVSIDSNADKLEISEIEELIEDIKEQDDLDIPSLKISLVQNNKKLNQIIIESGESKVSIQKIDTTDSLSYNISCDIKEIAENTETTDLPEVDIYFNVQYKGLDNLSNVQENYEIGFGVETEEDTMKYIYKIDTNTEFSDTVSIEDLDENVAIFLNDYNETQLTPFLAQVGERLLSINKKQMNELGLEEYENPLLYSNPITMLGVTIFNMASNTITDTNLTQLETNVTTNN